MQNSGHSLLHLSAVKNQHCGFDAPGLSYQRMFCEKILTNHNAASKLVKRGTTEAG
jgi:hypothetical protein